MEDLIEIEYQSIMENLKSFPFEDKEAYKDYLAQTYFFTKHSGKLMIELSKCASDSALKKVFHDHGKEEAPHYLLAKSDLESLGGKIGDFEELESTKRLYGMAFKYMEDNPYSLLGYVLCLEFLAVKYGGVARDRVASTWGYEATTFLAEHNELDQEHTQEMLQALNSLSDENIADAKKLLIESFSNFKNLLNDIRKVA